MSQKKRYYWGFSLIDLIGIVVVILALSGCILYLLFG